MALFQKKPQTSSSAPLYTLGLSKTVLIVGLGNIGKAYADTRHNIGFKAVDELVSALDLPAFVTKKDLSVELTLGNVSNTRVIVAKPTTMMNLSGNAVQAVAQFYKIPSQDVFIVHDELDIPFGQIRTRMGGGSAGNNGVKSVIETIGDNFGRVRIGIHNDDNAKIDSADFVLAKFSTDEQAALPKLLKETTAILTELVYGGQLLAETRSWR